MLVIYVGNVDICVSTLAISKVNILKMKISHQYVRNMTEYMLTSRENAMCFHLRQVTKL